MFALPKWITDIKKLFGTADGKVLGRVGGAWEFLSSFVPSSHKTSHATGGSDVLTPADIGAVADDDARLSDARTPLSHYQDASSVTVYTGNFSGNLSAADDTVQKVAETLDGLVAGGGGVSIPESVDPPENPEEGQLWIDLSADPINLPLLSAGNLVEKKIITADCPSVTFTGLDSLVDGDYILQGSTITGNIATKSLYLFVNGDESLTNYKGLATSQQTASTAPSGSTFNSPSIHRLRQNYHGVFEFHIRIIGSAVYGRGWTENSESAEPLYSQIYSFKKLTAETKITSIKLSVESGTNSIAVGSIFTLYKSNSAQQLIPYNPVDITSRTSDYPLKPGEVVYIDYINATSVPLHVATQEGEYEVTIVGFNLPASPVNGNNTLSPNNTTYANAIKSQHTDASGASITTNIEDRSTFGISYAGSIRAVSRISTFTQGKSVSTDGWFKFNSGAYEQHKVTEYWVDTTTPWTSLGTITFPSTKSGKIIIKRII
jgi:hypothetical protein